jgi:hypothetical protein
LPKLIARQRVIVQAANDKGQPSVEAEATLEERVASAPSGDIVN